MRLRTIALLAVFIPLPALACTGDCDGNGTVTVNELVVDVQVALGSVGADRCADGDENGDGRVAITELVAAVDSVLNGCGGSQATPTVRPQNCGDGTAEGDEECDDGNTNAGDGCDAGCQLEPGGDPCAGVAA